MVLLLGASSYVGQSFARELRRRGCCFVPLSREAFDYTCFEFLFDYMRKMKPDFLINAAGYTDGAGDDGESAREDILWANTILPQTVGRVCLMTNTPWGHVSSGSVYAGAKVVENGRLRIEKDLSLESLQQLFRAEPDRFYGFGESDEPNSSFRHAPCSFYSGTKALAEEAIGELGQSYIWRPHLPFNEQDEPCNWLSELQRYPTVCDQLNSVSHLDDCIRACLDLWERRAPYGIYHVANPGPVSTRQVMEMIQRILKPSRSPEFTGHDGGNGSAEPLVARTGCLLDVSKMIAAGVKMRSAQDAIGDALDRWRPAVMRPLRIPNRTAEVLPATG